MTASRGSVSLPAPQRNGALRPISRLLSMSQMARADFSTVREYDKQDPPNTDSGDGLTHTS
jgi:hypothetical protein